jgi:transposase
MDWLMDVISKQVDVVPMVKHYIEEMGLHTIFDRHVPNENGADIKPASVFCTLITNILVASEPLYKVEEWLSDYMDGKTEAQALAKKYNDDRCAREMDHLFAADRHSMITEAAAAAVGIHNLETDYVHNDSTSVTFSGRYESQSPDAIHLEHGHNKDHRPDLKQIVFGLNITEDGHVPLSYQAYDGATADIATHQPNWDSLRTFLDKTDFTYIADCKLYSSENLQHIDQHGGKFITLAPKNIKEIKQFIARIKEGEVINWQAAYEVQNNRKTGRKDVFQTYDNERSAAGYRIVWVHSSTKEARDKNTRQGRLEKAEKKLAELSPRLNRYYLKTAQQINKAVADICSGTGEQLTVEIKEQKSTETGQVKAGRAGANTQYKEQIKISYHLEWHRNEPEIEQESRADGLFPLVSNDEIIEPAGILEHYKQQPFLEKRFHTSKSTLEVAPIFLHKNERIEAMLFLYFIALMIVSLIERNIRQQMEEQEIESLPIRPTGLNCKRPTWDNIRYFFRNIYLSMIRNGTTIISTKIKGVTLLHRQLLNLLKVPESRYLELKDFWWEYEFSP